MESLYPKDLRDYHIPDELQVVYMQLQLGYVVYLRAVFDVWTTLGMQRTSWDEIEHAAPSVSSVGRKNEFMTAGQAVARLLSRTKVSCA